VPKESQYLFDVFTDGRVLFIDGTSSSAKMNYNTLLGEMQFIDLGTGDVLSLDNIKDVTSVTVDGRYFIPARTKDEFMEVLVSGKVSLAIRYKGDAISISKEGAYGSVSTAVTGPSSYSTLSPGDNMLNQKLAVKEQIAVKLFSFCYLVKDNKPVIIRGIKTFLNTYPKDKAFAINKYVNDNKVNFNSRESLIAFTRFVNDL